MMITAFPNKNTIVAVLFLGTVCTVKAQNIGQELMKDSIQLTDSAGIQKVRSLDQPLNYKRLIVPAALISVGALSMEIPALKRLNYSTRDEVVEDQYRKTTWDNYTQYVPGALVFGLNAAGVKSAHNLRERAIIYSTSVLITTAIVTPLKHWVKEERPDHSNRLSFPSGHTATAFANAQFMFREYKDTNLWLGLAGYPIAIFTGTYRAINNKHWAGDIVAGAGIGILSTELAYWLAPKIDRLLFKKNQKQSVMIMPVYQDKSVGIGFTSVF
jgi:hypothetical protein